MSRREQKMSVIDFLAARRKNNEGVTETATAMAGGGKARMAPGAAPLTPNQFTRHIGHIVEDEMRRSLKRHVDVIDPREMIDLAKMLADLKAKYIGLTLTIASNKTPLTDAELEQLRALRLKLQELEAAYNEVNEAIASQLVEVRGVTKD